MNTLVFTDIKITADSVDVKAQFSYTDKKPVISDGSASKPVGMDFLEPTKSNNDFDYMFCLFCVLDVILLCSIGLATRLLYKRIKLLLRKPEGVHIADRGVGEREPVVSSGQGDTSLVEQAIEENVDVRASGDHDLPQAPEEGVTRPKETDPLVVDGEHALILVQEDVGLAPETIEEINNVDTSGEETEEVHIADHLEGVMEQDRSCDQTDLTDVGPMSQAIDECIDVGASGDGVPRDLEESGEDMMESETEESPGPMKTQVRCCLCGIALDEDMSVPMFLEPGGVLTKW